MLPLRSSQESGPLDAFGSPRPSLGGGGGVGANFVAADPSEQGSSHIRRSVLGTGMFGDGPMSTGGQNGSITFGIHHVSSVHTSCPPRSCFPSWTMEPDMV